MSCKSYVHSSYVSIWDLIVADSWRSRRSGRSWSPGRWSWSHSPTPRTHPAPPVASASKMWWYAHEMLQQHKWLTYKFHIHTCLLVRRLLLPLFSPLFLTPRPPGDITPLPLLPFHLLLEVVQELGHFLILHRPWEVTLSVEATNYQSRWHSSLTQEDQKGHNILWMKAIAKTPWIRWQIPDAAQHIGQSQAGCRRPMSPLSASHQARKRLEPGSSNNLFSSE